MKGPSFWQWLTLRRPELAGHGIPTAEVPRRRMRITGHDRPLTERWAQALGSWGRVLGKHDIARMVGRHPTQVKRYAESLDLRTATRKIQFKPTELALALWLERDRGPAESCRRYGVLRAERVLYCAGVEAVRRGHDASVEDLLHWSLLDFEEAWRRLGIRIGPPLPDEPHDDPYWLAETMERANVLAAREAD